MQMHMGLGRLGARRAKGELLIEMRELIFNLWSRYICLHVSDWLYYNSITSSFSNICTILILSLKFYFSSVKVIAHWVRNFHMRFSVFPYSSSFPIKMHATDAKTQKIEPDPNIFMTDESFGGSV